MKFCGILSYFKIPTIPKHNPDNNAKNVVKQVAKGNLLIQRGRYSTQKDISTLKKKLAHNGT